LSVFVFNGRNEKITDADIILVSNTQYPSLHGLYPNLAFKRVFYDEADSISIRWHTSLAPGLFYWFMTASYTKLVDAHKRKQYVRSAVLTTFANTNPTIVKYLCVKNNNDFVKQAFRIPDYKEIVINCMPPIELDILKNSISETVQRLLYAGDIDGAIKTFNIKSSSSDNIVDIVCADIVDKLNGRKAQLALTENQTYSSKEVKTERINNITTKIAKLEENLENIRKKIRESNIDPITYLEIENPVVMSCCKTVFDFESITLYITTKNATLCPICRTAGLKENMILQTDKTNEELDEESAPIPVPEKILKKPAAIKNLFDTKFNSKSKIIAFSEYDASFEMFINIVICV